MNVQGREIRGSSSRERPRNTFAMKNEFQGPVGVSPSHATGSALSANERFSSHGDKRSSLAAYAQQVGFLSLTSTSRRQKRRDIVHLNIFTNFIHNFGVTSLSHQLNHYWISLTLSLIHTHTHADARAHPLMLLHASTYTILMQPHTLFSSGKK